VLSTAYKILFNGLLSRFAAYVGDIIGVISADFDAID
jgi:hypothetical protein